MMTFFFTLFAIIVLNLIFYAIPFIFVSAEPEDVIPYQIWFNTLIILIALLPHS